VTQEKPPGPAGTLTLKGKLRFNAVRQAGDYSVACPAGAAPSRECRKYSRKVRAQRNESNVYKTHRSFAAAKLMRYSQAALTLFVCFLCACAAREVLIPKSGAAPEGVDLSGTWRLRKDAGAEQRRINEAIRRTDGVKDSVILRQPDQYNRRNRAASASRRSPGGLVHVFLETGTTLKITQTVDGLFLSFDRAVVVEYRFGENREVSIGPVVADRVSGWEGRQYIAETLDRNNMKLTERFAMINHHTLQRTIIFRSKNDEEETIVQTFDRVG
jgi:hypothetical protein